MDQHNMTTHAAYDLYERRGKAEGHDLADLLEGIRMIPEPGCRDEEAARQIRSGYKYHAGTFSFDA
jgi:hypothetical protein